MSGLICLFDLPISCWVCFDRFDWVHSRRPSAQDHFNQNNVMSDPAHLKSPNQLFNRTNSELNRQTFTILKSSEYLKYRLHRPNYALSLYLSICVSVWWFTKFRIAENRNETAI